MKELGVAKVVLQVVVIIIAYVIIASNFEI
jgi:hypothetical protein